MGALRDLIREFEKAVRDALKSFDANGYKDYEAGVYDGVKQALEIAQFLRICLSADDDPQAHGRLVRKVCPGPAEDLLERLEKAHWYAQMAFKASGHQDYYAGIYDGIKRALRTARRRSLRGMPWDGSATGRFGNGRFERYLRGRHEIAADGHPFSRARLQARSFRKMEHQAGDHAPWDGDMAPDRG